MGLRGSKMNFKETIQNLAILGIGQIVVIILNVVFYFLLASILGPEKYGNLVYLLSIAIVVPTITRFGFSQSIIIFLSKREFELEKITNQISLVIAIITSLFLAIFDPIVALYAFSFSSFVMQMGNYLGQKNYKLSSFSQVSRSVIWIGASVILYFELGISGILLGMTIGNLVFSFNYFKSIRFSKWNFSLLRSKSKIIVNNFGVDISRLVPNQVDKLIIFPLFGFQTTGIFHFVIQVMIAIESLTLVLQKFLLAERSKKKISRRFLSLVIITSMIVILAGIFLSPLIIKSIFPDFIESIFAVQIIVFGVIPLFFISILYAKLQVLESNYVGYGVIVRIASNLALIPFLGTKMGLVGLVISYLISLILLSIFLLIVYKKHRKSENLEIE